MKTCNGFQFKKKILSFSEFIDLQGPMIFFQVLQINSGLISETKIGFKHNFEKCIFKSIRFCFRGKKLQKLQQ